MRTHANVLVALTLAVAAASSPAFAQEHGHGHGNDKDRDRGHGSGERENRDRDEQRGNEQNRGRQPDRVYIQSNGNVARVPPGLAKKPGGMPPGQYKKYYRPSDGVVVLRDVFNERGYTVVRTSPYGASQYVYYRAPDGTVRRAIVSPGATRLNFTNVPMALLQEILARLY
ncbi:MAG TPA: hypothetical protein VF929_09375 [Gemmatimonadaceae bacterium]